MPNVILMYIFIFIYGLTFGSFYNVVGLRVPEKKSIVSPRSACPHCGHQLTWRELIPVFSYMIQRGKCRNCNAPISPIYPIVELLTGVLFAIAPVFVGWEWELLVAWTFISLLMIIIVSDIKYMLIPNRILLVFTGIFFVERILLPLNPWWDSLAGAVVGFVILYLIGAISKGGMGGGDIKLFALIGFVVGLKKVLLSFFLSTLFGAVIGVFLLLFKIVKRGEPIPFGPFIAIGTLIAYFAGEKIIDWYIQLL